MTFEEVEFKELGDLEAVRAGKAVVYYWGVVWYDDAFGKPHRTRFRLFLDFSMGAIRTCPKGNDAT